MKTLQRARKRLLITGLTAGLSIPLLISGCTVSSGIPGVPDIKLDVPDSTAQAACKAYAAAWSMGTTRESITGGLQNAQALASASTEADATSVARAIDEVLANTVYGTQDSLYAANDDVIAICGTVGVSIQVEE